MDMWGTFAKVIPLNTVVRWDEFADEGGTIIREGMLLEFAPYRSTEVTSRYGDAGAHSLRVVCQPFNERRAYRIEVTSLMFQINDQWLNFWQAMSRDPMKESDP